MMKESHRRCRHDTNYRIFGCYQRSAYSQRVARMPHYYLYRLPVHTSLPSSLRRSRPIYIVARNVFHSLRGGVRSRATTRPTAAPTSRAHARKMDDSQSSRSTTKLTSLFGSLMDAIVMRGATGTLGGLPSRSSLERTVQRLRT